MKQPKQKNCIECGKLFNQYNSLVKVCSTECAIKVAKVKVEIKTLKEKETLLSAFNERKESKQLKASLINTKMQIHAYIRNRDKYKPCISCGTQWNDDFQAGHFYKSETFETLKYHLHNINGQCKRCNLFLDGAFDNYSLNLPNRIGQENYNELVKLAEIDKHHSKVWNIENLKEVRKLLKENKSYILNQ